jgi:uncharacterized protein YqgV (UPF0045/DUF77 family)
VHITATGLVPYRQSDDSSALIAKAESLLEPFGMHYEVEPYATTCECVNSIAPAPGGKLPTRK